MLSMLFAATVGVVLVPRESGASGTATASKTEDQCRPGGKNAPAGTRCLGTGKCFTEFACDGNGACVGKPVLCPSGPCNTSACNASTGACDSTNKPDGTACAGGTCKAGICSFHH
jgi:hypothetical protein